jgi:NAD(P)-dependent dehydrogenase (short-subunit alcohol dehydrogenase family)
VADAEAILEGIAKAEKAVGTVTIAVNNAGIPDAPLAHRMSVELIDEVIGTVLRGPYILACEVGRRLIAAKIPGRIIMSRAWVVSITQEMELRTPSQVGDSPNERGPRRRMGQAL